MLCKAKQQLTLSRLMPFLAYMHWDWFKYKKILCGLYYGIDRTVESLETSKLMETNKFYLRHKEKNTKEKIVAPVFFIHIVKLLKIRTPKKLL